MYTNKLYILFVLAKNRKKQDGKAPIYCRLTFKKKRKQFSTGLFTESKDWDSKKQLVKNADSEALFKNTQLGQIVQKANEAYLYLKVNNTEYDVEDIYLQLIGKNAKRNKTVLEVFSEHILKIEKLVGKEYVIATLWKYKQAKRLLKAFVKHQYNKNDFNFKDLNIDFITRYEFYLKTEKELASSTAYKVIQRFKRIVKVAISEDYLNKDPFILYRMKRPKHKIVYLNTKELANLEAYKFSQSRLNLVRDLFIFCCYTGLAYREMSNLKEEHLIIGRDKSKCIQMTRDKTQAEISIPLLPKAEEVLKKYSGNDYLLPSISNQKINSYLKEIADIVGIKKKLTHHIARKTFATTVLLYNDVPIEIVSELLGHSQISITQEHYAKVVKSKVSEQMEMLKKKLRG